MLADIQFRIFCLPYPKLKNRCRNIELTEFLVNCVDLYIISHTEGKPGRRMCENRVNKKMFGPKKE
jgi:hypothetical protein